MRAGTPIPLLRSSNTWLLPWIFSSLALIALLAALGSLFIAQQTHAESPSLLAQPLGFLVVALVFFIATWWVNFRLFRRLSASLNEQTRRTQESINLLDTLFRSCPTGLALWDKELKFIRVNESLAEIGQASIGAHSGKTPWEMSAPWWPCFESALRKSMELSQPVTSEASFTPQPGVPTQHWVAHFFPVSDSDGQPSGLGAFFCDVSDRKRIENHLSEWNERFTLAAEASEVGVWEWDPHTRRLLASRHCKAMLGYQDCELGPHASDWEALVHPEDENTSFAAWKLALESDDPSCEGEYRLRHKDGSYRWVMARAKRESMDKRTKVVGALIDMTQRKQAELTTKRTCQQMQAVVQNAPYGLALLDLDYRYIHINATLAALNAIPEPECLGKKVADILPALWSEIRPHYESIRQNGRPLVTENKDDRGEYWQSTYFPVWENDTELLGFGVVVVDITDAKRREQKVRELAMALQKSNTELEKFAYVASHDLKEPLRMISTYLGLVEQKLGTQIDDKTAQYMGFALDGAKRLGSLINSLLALSRLGCDPLSMERLPLGQVLGQTLGDFHAAITEVGATIQCDPLPTIYGNRAQIGQVFSNLLSNALKFSPPNHRPNIRISTTDHGDYTQITVTDNGLGIAPENHEKIFDIFSRLHGRKQYPGDGIGLAACKKIVEAHGGRIWVDSALEKGCAIHFTVPKEGVQRVHESSASAAFLQKPVLEGLSIKSHAIDP